METLNDTSPLSANKTRFTAKQLLDQSVASSQMTLNADTAEDCNSQPSDRLHSPALLTASTATLSLLEVKAKLNHHALKAATLNGEEKPNNNDDASSTNTPTKPDSRKQQKPKLTARQLIALGSTVSYSSEESKDPSPSIPSPRRNTWVNDTPVEGITSERALSGHALNQKEASSSKSTESFHRTRPNQVSPQTIPLTKKISKILLPAEKVLPHIQSVLSKWFQEYNVEKFVTALEVLSVDACNAILCKELVEEVMLRNGVAVAHTAKLLPRLVTEGFVSVEEINIRLSEYAIISLVDSAASYPFLYKYFGILYGTMTANPQDTRGLFSLASLHALLKPVLRADTVLDACDFPKAPVVLAQVLDCVQVLRGEEALMLWLDDQDFDLRTFWPAAERLSLFALEDWFEENGLDCLLST
ncbi:hypothetical protein BJ741DRAFT_602417 [Chytriomyces cf. hyalinus JEL632]|nr:hypothetical protein BJ741DRAFT_602417 [Chytriomyces cf. hyalinus JEL632]